MTLYIWLTYSPSDYELYIIFDTLIKIQQPNVLLQEKVGTTRVIVWQVMYVGLLLPDALILCC